MKRRLMQALGTAAAGITLTATAVGSTAAAAPVRHSFVTAPFDGRLYGVSATSPRDAWAVGLNRTQSLIAHWNGTNWTRKLSSRGFLRGAAAASRRSAWAVGGTDWFSPQTLVEHWDGHAWTQVPSPGNAPGTRTVLNAVAAASPRNAWAVGSTDAGDTNRAFIVHWDGTAWHRVDSPTPVPGVSLLGVAATSPRNAWAVGQTAFKGACGPTCATVIEHWDGSAWTLVPSPNPPSVLVNVLLGVAATSPRNAWAVGTNDYQSTLIVRWNGQAWK